MKLPQANSHWNLLHKRGGQETPLQATVKGHCTGRVKTTGRPFWLWEELLIHWPPWPHPRWDLQREDFLGTAQFPEPAYTRGSFGGSQGCVFFASRISSSTYSWRSGLLLASGALLMPLPPRPPEREPRVGRKHPLFVCSLIFKFL